MGNPLSSNARLFWSAIINELTNEINDPEILHPLSVDFEKIRQTTKLGMDEQLLAMIELERAEWITVQRKMNGKVDWVVIADTTKEEALLIMGESEGHREENGECFACNMESTTPNTHCQEKKQSPTSLFDLDYFEPVEDNIYQPFIDYWVSKYLAKPNNYKQVIETLRSARPPITLAQFKTAVDNFSLAARSPYHWPKKSSEKKRLQRKSLVSFLTTIGRKQLTAYNFYLQNKPDEILLMDYHPNLTQILIKKFRRVFDPNNCTLEYSMFDMRQFTSAANHLHKTMEQLRKQLPPYVELSDEVFAEWMVQSLKDSKIQHASPKNLTTDYFLNTIFPNFLRTQQFVPEQEEKPVEYKMYIRPARR